MCWPCGRRLPVAERRITKILALTRADLLRQLPAVLAPAAYRVDGDEITASVEGRNLIMELLDLDVSRMGRLALPQLRLIFTFTDWRQADIDAFMRRFERVYRRGGG